MCTSKGAPPHPKGKKVNDDIRAGADALWDLCQKHNAVFLADPEFDAELKKFLDEHRIKKPKNPTGKQKEYVGVIEKGLKASPSVVA